MCNNDDFSSQCLGDFESQLHLASVARHGDQSSFPWGSVTKAGLCPVWQAEPFPEPTGILATSPRDFRVVASLETLDCSELPLSLTVCLTEQKAPDTTTYHYCLTKR